MQLSLLLLLLLNCILQSGTVGSYAITGDTGSSQQLEKFGRRLSNKHVLSNGLRRLKDQTSDCGWEKVDKKCSISESAAVKILKTVDTPFSKFLIGYSVCFDTGDEQSCNAAEACHWDSYSRFCELSDIEFGHRTSPCYKAAPLFFKYVHFSTQCAKIKDIPSCQMNIDCTWSFRVYGCEADFYHVFFGIKSFEERTQELGEQRAGQISDILEASGATSAPGFKWEDMLDYKIPHLDCPGGTLQLTCDVVDVYLASFLPVFFYCRGKHKTQQGCVSDRLCQDAGASVCWPSDAIIDSSYEHAIDFLDDTSPDPLDKEFVNIRFNCNAIREPQDCTGSCVWNSMARKCVFNEQYLTSILAKPGEGTDDGLCKLLETASTSDCEIVFDKSVCEEKEYCHWYQNECETRDEHFIEAAVKDDAKMSKLYSDIIKKCGSYSSETECSGEKERHHYFEVV